MGRVRAGWAIGGLVALCGASAQPVRADGGSPPRVEKPVSRHYGTVQPPVAPPAVVRPHPGAGAHVDRPAHYDRPVHVHRPRTHVDIVIGAPPRPYYYGPRYYGPRHYPSPWTPWPPPVIWAPPPPPVVISPPVVVSPPAPPVYIERGDVATAESPPAAGYWYWCADPQGWYPELGECPAGWQPVLPRPAQ